MTWLSEFGIYLSFFRVEKLWNFKGEYQLLSRSFIHQKKNVSQVECRFLNKGGPCDRYKWGEITPINGPKYMGFHWLLIYRSFFTPFYTDGRDPTSMNFCFSLLKKKQQWDTKTPSCGLKVWKLPRTRAVKTNKPPKNWLTNFGLVFFVVQRVQRKKTNYSERIQKKMEAG